MHFCGSLSVKTLLEITIKPVSLSLSKISKPKHSIFRYQLKLFNQYCLSEYTLYEGRVQHRYHKILARQVTCPRHHVLISDSFTSVHLTGQNDSINWEDQFIREYSNDSETQKKKEEFFLTQVSWINSVRSPWFWFYKSNHSLCRNQVIHGYEYTIVNKEYARVNDAFVTSRQPEKYSLYESTAKPPETQFPYGSISFIPFFFAFLNGARQIRSLRALKKCLVGEIK